MVDKELTKQIIATSEQIQGIARTRYIDDNVTEDDYQGCIEGQLLKLIHITTERVKEKYGITENKGADLKHGN